MVKRRDSPIMSSRNKRDECKLTSDEASKGSTTTPKPELPPCSGSSMADAYVLAMWCPVFRRHDSYSGFRSAAMLADVPTGESPAGGNCPVTTVVIPGVGEGDQPDGSPGVKASVGREIPGRIRQGRQATRQVVAKQTSVATKSETHRKRMVGVLGSAEPVTRGRRPMSSVKDWVRAAEELPGVVEGGMSRRNKQRKHGTTRGSPRRTSTAKASDINCCAAKFGCACEWDG